jgi:parallel beta-helix repeat protein
MSLLNFASLLKRIFPARSTRGQRRRLRNRAALQIVYLEDRFVPAVTDVTTGLSFTTIQAAVSAANPGDTILADAGTYSEMVTIAKPLTLQGAQHGVDARTRSVPASQESIVSNGEGDFQIEADNVTIDGFTLQGVTSNPSTDPASLGVAIWTNPGFSGTHGGVQIVNNIIQGNIAGIELDNDGSFQARVQFNLFQDNDQTGAGGGTDIETNFGLSNALIDSNTFTNTSFVEDAWALGVSAPSDHITFSNNSVTNHGRGIYFFSTSDAVVTGNTILGASHYAIGLFGNNGSPANSSFTISNNTLDANGSGGAGLVFVNDTSAAAYSGTLTVADAAGANVSATEGSAFTGVVATFTDPTGSQAAGDYSATITWGDQDASGNPLTSQGTIVDLGGGHFQVVGSHTYAAEASGLTFAVTVQDVGEAASISASASVDVADAALSAGQLTPPALTEGISTGDVVLFHFSDANPGATAADYTAVVNWGDGSSDSSVAANPVVSVVANPNGGFDVVGSHTYAEEASGLTFAVTVQDVGGAAPISASASVDVADAALNAGQLTPPAPTEGISTGDVVLFHFSDANPGATAADYTAVVNWGDGSSDSSVAANPVVSVVANPNGGFDVVGSHTYAEEASGLTFAVTVQDVGGAASISASVSVDVADAALSAGQLTPLAPTEGISTGNVVLFHFSDANPGATAADYTAVVNWGDGSSDSSVAANPVVSVVANPNGGFDVVGSHTYAAEASGLTFAVTVQDVGGAAPLHASATVRVAGAVIFDGNHNGSADSGERGVGGPMVLAQEQSSFTVPGTPNEVVLVRFQLLARQASFHNEVGMFIVDDAQGRIAGLLPSHPQYLRRAVQLGRWRVIFRRGQRMDSTLDIPLNGGARLMFYLVPNDGLRTVLRRNPRNRLSGTPVVLFADGRWNPDRMNHLRTSPLPNGVVLRWEDEFRVGDHDFNDAIVSVQLIRRLV